MKRRILVLTEYIEGGEWIATKRLTGAVSKYFPDIKFYFLSFRQDIKHADDSGFLGFLRAFVSDFKTARKTLGDKVKTIGTINYLISTNYVFLLASLWTKKIKGIKKIYYFHGFKSQPINNHRQIFIRFMEWTALLQSNYIIAVYKFAWPFGFFKKIYLLPNSAPDSFYKLDIKNKGRKSNQKTILYSGRIAAHKGLENLIESFNMYSKRHKNTRLVLCYPQSSADKKLFKTLKKQAKSNVSFIADLELSSLKKIYENSDLTILPSEIEMGPLSVIESFACRTPVIGTRTGNIPEILNKIDSGLILKNNSPSEIVNKLTWYFNLNSCELEVIRRKGYEVSKSYSSLNSAKKFLKILESFK